MSEPQNRQKAAPKRKPTRTSFKAGKSGNPGGRPKISAEVRELARAHTDDAIRALLEVCNRGTSEAARVAAANAILDRGYGRPVQQNQLVDGDGKPTAPVYQVIIN